MIKTLRIFALKCAEVSLKNFRNALKIQRILGISREPKIRTQDADFLNELCWVVLELCKATAVDWRGERQLQTKALLLPGRELATTRHKQPAGM